MKPKTRKVVLGIVAGLVLLVAFIVTRFFCFSAWARYGISVGSCPDGRPRQTLSAFAEGLRRGSPGTVRIGAQAHYTTGPADRDYTAWVGRVSPQVFLVQGSQETPLVPKGGWEERAHWRVGEVTLPQIPDGDYLLRAKVKTPLAEQTIDVPLPVYAPARVHVLTDRPLYEPGNTVLFRSVALRAKDLAPLDGRPGVWSVMDPSGEVLLEEKSPAGAWGVASGSFPLDSGAASGDWRVLWSSGDAQGEATFRVEPFTLPRFRVEASPHKPYYRPGEKPVVRGSVAYSSGAPVVGAKVALRWNVFGDWPAPVDWTDGGLAQTAVVDRSGRFTLELPPVPGDLRGQVTLSAALDATDPAGDHVSGSVAVLLTQEAIKVSAVTEIGEALVQGFNNRMYLRVTDAAGMVLPKAELVVKRAWDPADKGIAAKADEDGVASLQVDPGPAVNVVIPAMPYRPRPRPRTVTLGSVEDLIAGGEPSLADRKVLDGWLGALEPCGRYVSSGAEEVELGVRADAAGNVTAVGVDGRPISRCVAQVLKDKRLAAGPERLLHLSYSLSAPPLPELGFYNQGVPGTPDGLEEALNEMASDARPCLGRNLNEEIELERFATWRTTKGSKQVALSWATQPKGEERRLRADPCVEGKFRGFDLEEAADSSAVGVLRLRAVPYVEPGESRPQPTTMLGYEFLVTARIGGEEVGAAKLRLVPGSVPSIRLRATPVLATAGGELKVEILRGPDFNGELPEKLWMVNEGTSYESKTDADRRSATFKIPASAQGWLQVSWGGAQALAYVAPKASLSVALRAEKERYAPGQSAKLLIETRMGEKGTSAAVGLSGVDESLAQLMPLPGPDEMARLRPQASMSSAAFGTLDAQALAMGRVRGPNAAAAVVLRVASPPPPQEIDQYVHSNGQGVFTPLEDLTDHFYAVLGELHAQTRIWEEKALESEKMRPQKMVELWEAALAACEKRGEAVGDAYGRRLRLSWLPPDLLSLVDPRQVVVRGTRLPEDMENWQAWVRKEEP
ncbi:MAG: hypothetical protein HY901_28765 [Deltaproteobacteria bacterium]|nr:hypothetical protein [Deltaproteobacteria bacterium]